MAFGYMPVWRVPEHPTCSWGMALVLLLLVVLRWALGAAVEARVDISKNKLVFPSDREEISFLSLPSKLPWWWRRSGTRGGI